MKDLMKKEDREMSRGKEKASPALIKEFREKIYNEDYIDHAIGKIASDLSHYLTKQK